MSSTAPQVADAFAAAIEAVKARGKSDVGQKTMLDVLVPVLDALARRRRSDCRSPAATASGRGGDHSDEGDARSRLIPRRPLDRPHGSRRAIVAR